MSELFDYARQLEDAGEKLADLLRRTIRAFPDCDGLPMGGNRKLRADCMEALDAWEKAGVEEAEHV